MLVEFSVKNYRSFRELQTLSLRATALVSGDKDVDARNIHEVSGQRLLKMVGVYGANGSGKSNIIQGLSFLRSMVTSSLETEGILKNYVGYFKLDDFLATSGSYFQIILLLEGKRYRYGFTVTREKGFEKEWLYGPAEKNETYYFRREGQKVDWNPDWFAEGGDIPTETKLREDALFLSFVSSYDGEISRTIRNFICEKILVDEGTDLSKGMYSENLNAGAFTKELIDNGKKDVVLDWLRKAGMNYTGLDLKKYEIGQGRNMELVILTKNRLNSQGEVVGTVPLWLGDDESSGTRKYFEYIGNLNKIFTDGGILVCDEIDSNFHPALLQKIVRSFQDPELNKSGAQLLFTSHDTNLMDPQIMRRDQFYFTEKTVTDSTRLYSLADLKGIRNNADFARQYLLGWYGALPMLDGFLTEKVEN